MKEPKILKDGRLVRSGFGWFARSSIVDGGRSVLFQYPSGTTYRVPLGYLLRWFVQPSDSQEEQSREGSLLILRSRRLKNPRVVRVYISDGSHYDVAWDTVLMACEPRYEHFGGLTPYFKDLAPRWLEQNGSFRTEGEGDLRAASRALRRTDPNGSAGNE